MFNCKTIKESDQVPSQVTLGFNSIQIVELYDGYFMSEEYPCYYLVGMVSYINYQDNFVGHIHPCRSIEQAEKVFSNLCQRFDIAESEVFNV